MERGRAGVLGMAPRIPDQHLNGGTMANSKSKHNRMKSIRRRQWKARKKRQAAAKKATTKK